MMHKIKNIGKSRLFSLLFLIVIFQFFSCKEKTQESYSKEKKEKKELKVQKDSLVLSVAFDQRSITGLNIPDRYFQSYSLVFMNSENEPKIVSKKIPKNLERQVLSFLGWTTTEAEISKIKRHYYVVDELIQELDFTFEKGNIILKNNPQVIVDDLFADYENLSDNLHAFESSQKESLVDSLFREYKQKNVNNELFLTLNEYHYLNLLQKINPSEKRVKEYLEKIENPIVGKPLGTVVFFYVKNNLSTFDFEKLNTENYSAEYIKLLSIGIFNFLRHEDQKGDTSYQNAIDWLKTTEMYQKDSVYIKKELMPLDNIEFKKKLANLTLYSTDFNRASLAEVIKKTPSKYYLIDFWATWCKPCIEGVAVMKEMEIPNNVKILSLSIDKVNVRDKWRKTSLEIGQTHSYLIEGNSMENKDFLNFIELQSVPRYILIDQNMNLIDEAFLHPQEFYFLEKLQNIEFQRF